MADNLSAQQFRTHVQNVSNVYEETPDKVKDTGKHWYDAVHEATAKGVRGTSLDVVHGAGLVAAVSPNMDWEKRNIDAFQELHSLKESHWNSIAAGDTSPLQGMSIHASTQNNLMKAHRILQGEHPDTVLTAPKTHAFYQNIAHPDVRGPVTIDGRAHDIANNSMQSWSHDRRISGSMTTPTGAPTANYRRYQHYEQVYTAAADAVSERHGSVLQPHQMQAITWEGGKHIERHIPTVSGLPRNQAPTRNGRPYIGAAQQDFLF